MGAKQKVEKEVEELAITPIKEQFNQLGEVKRSFTPEQVKFITDTIAPNLTQNEVWLFLLKASVLKLNPLLGEIFAYVSKDKEGRRQLVVIAARDGKRASAQRTGKIMYLRTEAIYVKVVDYPADKEKGVVAGKAKMKCEPWDGVLWGATSTVKRSDNSEPFSVTVPLIEYDRGNYIWKNKPETMIKKVAESQALSMAFPQLGGVYDESERFDAVDEVVVPQIEGGGEPATSELLTTIKVLGGDTERTYTKQEAIEEITNLNAAKRKKGKE